LLVLVLGWLVWLAPAAAAPATTTHAPQVALPAHQELRFDRFTLDHGLSNNFITSVLQDQEGFIWVGTDDGLNRFDGYTFRTYRSDPTNPHTLPNNVVQALAEDQHGMLWIGTEAGLVRFDPVQERFTTYQHDPADPYSLSNDIIFALAPAADGTLWVGTDDGLNHFDPVTEMATRYLADLADPARLSNAIINVLYFDASGALWVGTEASLNRFDAAQQAFTSFTSFDALPIHTIVQDTHAAEETFWVGTAYGLARFTPASGATTWYHHDRDDPSSLSREDVRRVLIDEAGILWVGTTDGGLNRFDPITETFTAARYEPGRSTSISNNAITVLYEDRENLLWVGTENGLSLLNKRKQQFHHITAYPGNIILDMTEDAAGLLWIGTNDGFSVLDPHTYERVMAYPGEDSTIRGPTGVAGNFVTDMYPDQDGDVWIATDADLLRFDPAARTFESYVERGMSDNVILTIHEDRDGVLWVGTDAGGVNRYDPTTDRFVVYTHNPADPNSLAGDRIEFIYEDRAGNLWFGGEGLTRLDPTRQHFTAYPHDPTGTAGLLAEDITDLWEDCQGNFWIGTSRGLSRLNPHTRTYTAYTTHHDLPNAAINSILSDAQCNLWLSTNQGLSRFDPHTETFRTYDTRDGLHTNDFQAGARMRAADGTLYFGGVDGMTAFAPAQIIDNHVAPPVTLTNFLLFHTPVSVGDDTSPLMTSISYADDIVLAHTDLPITFEFAALSYAAPSKNHYAYQLEGYDSQWYHVASDRRLATYTALPAGSYTFRVRAANNADTWSTDEAAVRLTIMPPWWGTWWFRALALSGIVASVLGVFAWRTHSIRARNRWLETQVGQRTAELQMALHEISTAKGEIEHLMHARTDAVRSVVHDLKHTVQAVQSAFDVWYLTLDSSFGQQPSIEHGYQRVTKTLRQQHDLLDELRDAALLESGTLILQPEPLDFRQLVQDVVEHMQPRFDLSGCALMLQSDDEPLPTSCDPRRLRRVIYNILENAYRYTTSVRDDGCVELTLDATANHITCTIRDNGRGIAADDLEQLGQKFRRLKQG
jgi:ligand-binding sensor domain-containing protein/signal transduction histidine kinase